MFIIFSFTFILRHYLKSKNKIKPGKILKKNFVRKIERGILYFAIYEKYLSCQTNKLTCFFFKYYLYLFLKPLRK